MYTCAKNHICKRIRIEKGDSIYLMTDGYANQKTEARKQPFGYDRLKNLILENSDTPMDKQHNMLNEVFKDFKGEDEQTDDVLIIGVRV